MDEFSQIIDTTRVKKPTIRGFDTGGLIVSDIFEKIESYIPEDIENLSTVERIEKLFQLTNLLIKELPIQRTELLNTLGSRLEIKSPICRYSDFRNYLLMKDAGYTGSYWSSRKHRSDIDGQPYNQGITSLTERTALWLKHNSEGEIQEKISNLIPELPQITRLIERTGATNTGYFLKFPDKSHKHEFSNQLVPIIYFAFVITSTSVSRLQANDIDQMLLKLADRCDGYAKIQMSFKQKYNDSDMESVIDIFIKSFIDALLEYSHIKLDYTTELLNSVAYSCSLSRELAASIMIINNEQF